MAEETELDLEILAQTPIAWLVTDDDVEVWLPKSQVTCDEAEVGSVCTFVIPDWLAVEKGLA